MTQRRVKPPGHGLPVPAASLSRGRVFLIGSLLLVFNAYFGTYAYVVVQALLWGQTSLLRGPLVLLFLIVPVNVAVLRLAPRFALSQAELTLLYAMLCLGTCVGGIGYVQFLVNQMAGPFYYATAENDWKRLLWPHIPDWLAPRAPEVVNSFYRGHTTLYDPAVLAAWAVPVLAWSAFISALFWVLLCVTSVFRRQWVEAERLTFPLVLLPLEMTERGGAGPFWKSPWMWAGFLIAGIAESVNFLSFLYPSIPMLPIKPVGPNLLDGLFTVRPWSEMGMFRLAFYPFAIGIGYLLSLDVSFSCWFFYLGVKATNVACALLGLSEGGGASAANRMPFIREQGMGAFLGIAGFSAWMARKSLARTWDAAFARRSERSPASEDARELMSSRLAILGGGAGLLFLVGFLVAAGISVPVAVVFVFVYVCVSLTLARIVSEAGAGWAWAPGWTTTDFATDLFGTANLTARNLTVLHGYTAWMSQMPDNPQPQQMQSLKMSQDVGISPRAFLGPLVWAIAFGTLCAFWAHLDIYYTYGAATAKVRPWLATIGPYPAREAASRITTPIGPDIAGLTAAAFGVVAAVGFSLLRLNFAGWPLHPLGYALATTESMDYMWFPFFLAWLAKQLTVRYGGIRAYRTALPFFLGLILGDYVVPALWGLFGMVTGYQQYMAFPH